MPPDAPRSSRLSRRTALSGVGAAAAGLNLGPFDRVLAQDATPTAMATPPDTQSPRRARNHTGAVALFVKGERPALTSGADILEIAQATTFYEAGRHRTDYEGGSVERVPRDATPDPIITALLEGLLLFKLTITGTPEGAFQPLGPGTYYQFVDFVEGQEDEEGRWIGRIVDTQGQVRCLVLGITVKQIALLNPDDPEWEAYRTPSIREHDIGAGDQLMTVGQNGVSTRWYYIGVRNRIPDVFCVPEPI